MTRADYLTEIQQRIIEAIRTMTDDLGYPPTIREIADAVGLASTSSVAHHLLALERQGVITHTARRGRTWQVRY